MPLDKVKYWTDLANYDLDTAEYMFAGGRWLYVGFMCHQVLEKILKAHWNKVRNDEPPFIHNLMKLAQSSGLATRMSKEQLKLIAEMMPLNIESRYPIYKEEISARLNREYCRKIIDDVTALKKWIENEH